MNIPFIGPAYTLASLPLDAQTCVNMYLIKDDNNADPKNDDQNIRPLALVDRPGLTLFGTKGAQIRGIFENVGVLYAVADNKFYTVSSTGVFTAATGSLSTSTGPISGWIANISGTAPTQIGFSDGTDFYLYTIATTTLSKPQTNISYVDMQNQFALGTVKSANQWQTSNAADFSTWSALNVGSVNSKSENIVAIKGFKQEAWAFTNKYVEIWDPDATQTLLPYSKRTDPIAILYGCAAANSIVQVDNTLFWLAQDEGGQSLVVRNEYYNTKVVSTEAISTILNSGTISDAVAYSYTLNGHVFYILNLPTLDITLAYDCSTKSWAQWASYRNQTGLNASKPPILGRFLGWCHAFVFGKHLVGDFNSGNIYQLDTTNYTDNGNVLLRERTTKHFIKGLKRASITNLQIDFETGAALVTGQGSNPQVMLQISKDGGRSFGPEKFGSLGLIGQYLWRTRWLSLGFARDWVFRVRFSDPCPFRIMGAVADVEAGDV